MKGLCWLPDNNRKNLAKYRLETSADQIDTAELLITNHKYKDVLNRSYYSIFNAMRAVLALDGVDFKKHSAVISYFRQNYIKPKIFDTSLSEIIGTAFKIRNQSDYDDFYVASKEDAIKQLNEAKLFYNAIEKYLNRQI